MNARLPRLLITLGDVAGIGPEIVGRAWPILVTLCRPIVVGDPHWVEWGIKQAKLAARAAIIGHPSEEEGSAGLVPCLVGSQQNLKGVIPGKVSAAAGQAAYDFLCCAIDLVMAGAADGIVTAPLHKEGLRAAGLPYPGHTEILAERTGVRDFAMVLQVGDLAVAHVTLHMALRDVFRQLTTQGIVEKIHLLHALQLCLLGRAPRLAVAALNPHAGDGGLFGDEEEIIITPAVKAAKTKGIAVSGPWPTDTLFLRAREGEFDGVVAMYHDQGHIALKLLGGWKAVNISAGLPIVRTSVAHGTAYNIAGKGIADPTSLIEAVRVAVRLTGQDVSKSVP
jgi:4-hydroxythreonine-4-phosphate dehydrogenase